MFIRKDITDVNPNEILHQTANDLISTSAGELMKVVVEETEDTEWELGDNVEW
jgi:hypothetical protein